MKSSTNKFLPVPGGVTAASGFSAAAVAAGIRYTRNDMALLVSETDAAVAGTFTSNRIQGATVKVCREKLRGRKARAIIINSGNANACNGKNGLLNAKRMCDLTAAGLGVNPATVFVCSTGTIGIPMPMDKVEAGIAMAVKALKRDGGDAAAKAIMTTDTVDKQSAVEFTLDRKTVRIGGMCKGAGMIAPNMATLLVFLTTDAAVNAKALQKALSQSVDLSFNRVTIDGDQSCNDTALLMANGAAGNRPVNEKHPGWKTFCAALTNVMLDLAIKVAKDGEGATKFVTVNVTGAASDADARKAAKAVSNSLLVKTAWNGGDPNWGRIIDAVGYSGAKVVEEKVDIRFDKLDVVKGGMRDLDVPLSALEAIFSQKEFTVNIDLRLGRGSSTMYTCDCSEEYIKINAEYMT